MNVQNKSKPENNKGLSWITAVRVLSCPGNPSPPCLHRMPSNTADHGPAVGQLRFSSGPTPGCSCLQCPQLSELVRFLLWGLSVAFHIFHRHRVCLVDCVDVICSLYSWWEGFGSSSLATLPLGFTCGVISTSARGFRSWGCPGGLGFAPVGTRCGGGAAAWVAGVLAAPGTQGGWWLGQQEI